MRYFLAILSLCAAWGIAPDEPPAQAGVDAAIDRGLGFLVKDAIAWKAAHNCVSCHHAGLTVWALREAKQRGHAVDELVLADLTKWIAESGNGTTSLPRPAEVPRAFNEKAVSLLLALVANPEPDAISQAGIKLMLNTVKADQLDDGSWAAWPETRPPMFGPSNDRATVSATLALLPLAGSDESAKIARDKGIQWLTTTSTDNDPQSIALRLVLWRRLGLENGKSDKLVAHISERQNGDGGWSQTPEMTSDAWATGQAVYALAHAGIGPNNARVAAHAFLVKTQREDGSWTMTSRPTKPGGEGSTSLIPITGAGGAWAVMGLARSR